jgi:hypothetical protein
MATTSKGFPYPVPGDGNDVPLHMQQLAEAVDAMPGVSAMTNTQRNALTGAARWNGRVILNLDTGRLERWQSSNSTWINPATPPKILRLPHTWTPPGEIRVSVGGEDYISPMTVVAPAGQTVRLMRVIGRVRAGTSVTVSFLGGPAGTTALAGFAGLLIDANGEVHTPTPVTLADLDLLRPVVTAVSGIPTDLSLTADLEYTS